MEHTNTSTVVARRARILDLHQRIPRLGSRAMSRRLKLPETTIRDVIRKFSGKESLRNHPGYTVFHVDVLIDHLIIRSRKQEKALK